MIIEQIAIICHSANKGICEAFGDFSQKDWGEAEQWQRDAAIAGVEHRLANPNLPADSSHTVWMAKKIVDGWIYGDVKDVSKKTHPDLIPFEQLNEVGQAKDFVFVAIVDSLRHLVK